MDEHTKEVLREQLDFLAALCKKCLAVDTQSIVALTQAMVSVAQVLAWAQPVAQELVLTVDSEHTAAAIGEAIRDNPQEGQALRQMR